MGLLNGVLLSKTEQEQGVGGQGQREDLIVKLTSKKSFSCLHTLRAIVQPCIAQYSTEEHV